MFPCRFHSPRGVLVSYRWPVLWSRATGRRRGVGGDGDDLRSGVYRAHAHEARHRSLPRAARPGISGRGVGRRPLSAPRPSTNPRFSTLRVVVRQLASPDSLPRKPRPPSRGTTEGKGVGEVRDGWTMALSPQIKYVQADAIATSSCATWDADQTGFRSRFLELILSQSAVQGLMSVFQKPHPLRREAFSTGSC
mgnify:CR=1 FL=1